MRVLITGAEGQLGRALSRQLGDATFPFDRGTLDITDRAQVVEQIHRTAPYVVVNCAAYTNVDQAEREADLCMAVNGRAVRYLAEACDLVGATLVQISTDYVYGGDPQAASPMPKWTVPHHRELTRGANWRGSNTRRIAPATSSSARAAYMDFRLGKAISSRRFCGSRRSGRRPANR